MTSEDHIFRYIIYITALTGLVTIWMNISVGLSIIMGGAIGALAFRLIVLDVSMLLRRVKMGQINQDKSDSFIRKSYMKRYVLYAATLLAAIINPYLNPLAAFCGLLIPRDAIYLDLYLGRNKIGD